MPGRQTGTASTAGKPQGLVFNQTAQKQKALREICAHVGLFFAEIISNNFGMGAIIIKINLGKNDMDMQTALPGQSASMQMPQDGSANQGMEAKLKSVTITDNGDGTYSVAQDDEQLESQQDTSMQPAAEQTAPINSVDEALAQAKQILTGGGKEDLKGIFNAQFPSGEKAEREEYGSRY